MNRKSCGSSYPFKAFYVEWIQNKNDKEYTLSPDSLENKWFIFRFRTFIFIVTVHLPTIFLSFITYRSPVNSLPLKYLEENLLFFENLTSKLRKNEFCKICRALWRKLDRVKILWIVLRKNYMRRWKIFRSWSTFKIANFKSTDKKFLFKSNHLMVGWGLALQMHSKRIEPSGAWINEGGFSKNGARTITGRHWKVGNS